jgi:hypothetical protein
VGQTQEVPNKNTALHKGKQREHTNTIICQTETKRNKKNTDADVQTLIENNSYKNPMINNQ